MFIVDTTMLPWIIIFCKLYRLVIVKIGTDVRKDIFAASTLLKFKNLAPVIIIPYLLTPGINASI